MAADPVTVELPVRGPFSLAASTRFLEGFAPAGAFASGRECPLALAFPVEGDWCTAGATVRQEGDRVLADILGDVDVEAARSQLARLLSLDVDGTGFAAAGRRDPVVGDLQQRYPGLRPVGFWSPYEAATWAIIGQRQRITQAARVKQRIAEEHGETVELDGRRLAAFPAPGVLREVDAIDGVSARKLPWLHAVADAALDGTLDGTRLRSLDAAVALAQLRELPGIGPFAAELVLVRGALHPDLFPTHERRLHAEMAAAYHLSDPTLEELDRIADTWRPFRSWVGLLLRTRREDETGEIGGRPTRITQSIDIR
ncbi:MAG: DNA-3-methyladenine glycosylase 2 family protein [Pseudonocardia sp.]|nr:DNA-3-methyladenine glycosylase 2 family protein [Pseudonocardia sp.]